MLQRGKESGSKPISFSRGEKGDTFESVTQIQDWNYETKIIFCCEFEVSIDPKPR